MEWVLRSPQIHSMFSSLGYSHPDGYHVNENCNDALESILQNIITEDKYLRNYRRSISFGQNIQRDLIPLLINAKEDKTIGLLIKILVNLTIPVECLLSLEVTAKTDIGRHTIFEINNLLSSTKNAFTDRRVTKVVMDFFKKNIEIDQKSGFSPDQSTNVCNILLFLRNILHITEDVNCCPTTYSDSLHKTQNQILWNLFSHSIDKVLIKLMTIPEATHWAVTMVQLVALLYKDQHVTTIHKLLNLWLESSLSESSEDNESNTSPPNRGSDDSPNLTSDPTSDSSDTGASGKSNGEQNSVNNGWSDNKANKEEENKQTVEVEPKPPDNQKDNNPSKQEKTCEKKDNSSSKIQNDATTESSSTKKCQKTGSSENSDCGYSTQIETQEVISTSSNEDEVPAAKPVHQKPHNPKQRINNKVRSNVTLQERKRKKIVKRGKANIINVKGLLHNTPTDDDISNVLKEFTVDFLLKGYNSLVQTLHTQIVTNLRLEIDTSHFFWLLTYFLKFATQIELELEHICYVLSYEIVSYLTAEGVNLCEQFELAIKLDGNDLKPSIRRLHLVVTAIREFVQAVEVYRKSVNMCNNDKEILLTLQKQMCETKELRSLLVLLLKHYNPKYHSKQYLQDLVVTNHILLLFIESVMKTQDGDGSKLMIEHIKQFATPEIMYNYGLLLEDYEGNGEYVNDCVFTLMHHVGGELGSLTLLYQPHILKTFTSIWKSEYEICDDWTDLLMYVINTFVKKPDTLIQSTNVNADDSRFKEKKNGRQDNDLSDESKMLPPKSIEPLSSTIDRWSEEELSSLSWYYIQCNTSPEAIDDIVKLFKEDGIMKTRESIIKELFRQLIINKEEFERYLREESERDSKAVPEIKESRVDDIGKLCEQLAQDNKGQFLDWVQTVLLETCHAKIYLEKNSNTCDTLNENNSEKNNESDLKKSTKISKVLSPVSYHSLLFSRSIPLVPWNCQQAAICKDLKFLQLLHKLGFHMPVDTGKVFIRIPHFWTPDYLYEVAAKISPIDTSKLKFSLSDISESSILNSKKTHKRMYSPQSSKTSMSPPDNSYRVHKQKHLASVLNFTPLPGSSYKSGDEEVNKANWLDLVQRSQDKKRPLDKNKSGEADENLMSPSMKTSRSECDITDTSLDLPNMSSKEDLNFSIGQVDFECDDNSVCDTASVASDLTRMYVSDEDEKPEVIPRPIIQKSYPVDDQSGSDVDSAIAEKRPRRQQYLSSF